MSGIYIHIPFCKQACYYCDFHFSTSLKKKDELIQALIKELILRKNEFQKTKIETIYFGGGTPSLLQSEELNVILDTIYKHYKLSESPEITLEANPDDLDETKIFELSKTRINRLSIGIQSFYNEDLKLMNRAHNAEEAVKCLKLATQYYDNISIDLIYGIPGLNHERWMDNIKKALTFNIPHISSYALTVEPRTALESMIKKGKIDPVSDTISNEQFHILMELLDEHDFIHYEISNFGKEGYFSKIIQRIGKVNRI